MSGNRISLRRVLVTVGTLAALSAGLLVLTGWSARVGGSQGAEPKAESKTAAFRVDNLVRSESGYLLSLQNASGKPINGYSIAVGAKSKLVVDLTIGDRIISAGEALTVTIPASNLQSQGTTAPPITVLAVLYEDGTGDGDPQAIAETRHRRIGVKNQLERMLPLLQAALAQPDRDAPAALTKLREQISSLPEAASGGMPPRAAAGLRGAKEDVLVVLDQLDAGGAGFREGLLVLKERVEKRLARLKYS